MKEPMIFAFLALSSMHCATVSGTDRLDRQEAQLKAFKDEVRADIATLKRSVEELATAQRSLESKQDRLAAQAGGAVKKPSGPDPKAVYSWPIGDAPVLGAVSAWVTIVEISDFQCPYCGRAQAALEQVRETYGDDVKLVFKHNPLPFHQRALPAAIAAECAGEQGQFWPMHDALFEDQSALEDDDLDRYAAKLPIDIKQWRSCMADERYKPRILGDQTYAMNMGARGTPTFYVNGRVLQGAQPFRAFRTLIDEELSKAKASGLKPKEYYQTQVVQNGKSRQ